MNKEKIILFLKELLDRIKKISLFLILIALGYSLCEIYHYTIKPKEVKAIKQTRNARETSVAINERGELMLINRVTGEYEIYQDSIGKSIFTIYANSMQSKYSDKTLTK